jgi:hypothetical protein
MCVSITLPLQVLETADRSATFIILVKLMRLNIKNDSAPKGKQITNTL